MLRCLSALTGAALALSLALAWAQEPGGEIYGGTCNPVDGCATSDPPPERGPICITPYGPGWTEDQCGEGTFRPAVCECGGAADPWDGCTMPGVSAMLWPALLGIVSLGGLRFRSLFAGLWEALMHPRCVGGCGRRAPEDSWFCETCKALEAVP